MKLLLVLVIATTVTCDLIKLDEFWMTSSTFQREHGYALIGHVIETLDVFVAECIEACQKSLKCFSYNYVDFKNGSFLCELSQSNRKQSPNSFFQIQGYEYGEPLNLQHCPENSCFSKDALEDGWYRLDASLLKLFYVKKTWQDARNYCKSLGGDLVSIKSQTEDDFIKEVMLYPSFSSRVAMNGYDDPQHLSLFEGAKVVSIDGVMAAEFDGVDDYASVKGTVLRSSFTIAFWTRVKNTVLGANLLNDAGGGKTVFLLVASPTKRYLSFKLKTVEENLIQAVTPEGSLTIDQWMHIAVTWNHTAKELKIFINSELSVSLVSTLENVELFYSGRESYTAGKNGRFLLHGWMRELYTFTRTLSKAQIKKLAGGLLNAAWIGLNDFDNEGLFQWSDKQNVTFLTNPEENNDKNDCVEIKKFNDHVKKWGMKECDVSQPFICEKSAL